MRTWNVAKQLSSVLVYHLRFSDYRRRPTPPLTLKYARHLWLRCSYCGYDTVGISEAFGVWCMHCKWYRNKQSGMLRNA